MTDDNLKLWKEMAQPPLSALKTIKGGRLSGMSNISPQWRWKIMTEKFGMVGFGWKYTTDKKWTSVGANDEHFCFVEISLYVKVGEEWSAPIPGSGGSMLVAKEKNGMHNNDEAFKMAETDALGTAMAKLGVGADIYLGTFDGSKYNEPKEFPKTVNSAQEAKHVASQSRSSQNGLGETLPSKDAKPVDEEFPPEHKVTESGVKGEFSIEQLKLAANVNAIKAGSGKDIPTIMGVINGLEKGKSHTVEEVIKMLTGEKDG